MSYEVTPGTRVSEAVMFHGVRVYRHAVQSIPTSSFTAVDWDTIVYDTDAFVVGGVPSTIITIPTGVNFVRISGQVGWEPMASGNQHWSEILLNGALPVPNISSRAFTGAVNVYSSFGTSVIAVSPGDTISMAVLQSNAGSINLEVDKTWLQVEVVKTPFGRP